MLVMNMMAGSESCEARCYNKPKSYLGIIRVEVIRIDDVVYIFCDPIIYSNDALSPSPNPKCPTQDPSDCP